MSVLYPFELYPNGCPCFDCLGRAKQQWKMWLCPTCGSKRCAGASHHAYHPKPHEGAL